MIAALRFIPFQRSKVPSIRIKYPFKGLFCPTTGNPHPIFNASSSMLYIVVSARLKSCFVVFFLPSTGVWDYLLWAGPQ